MHQTICADEIIWQLNLKLSSNNVNVFLLSEKPEVTFDGENAFIISNNIETAYPLNEIKSFSFEKKILETDPDDSGNAIDTVEVGTKEFIILNAETIICKGCNSSSNVYVMNIAGSPIKADINYSNAEFAISLRNQPSGVYIINVEGQSIKVKK